MIRLTMVNDAGKVLLPQDLATAADLQEVVDRARSLIRECERLVDHKYPRPAPQGRGGVPYV